MKTMVTETNLKRKIGLFLQNGLDWFYFRHPQVLTMLVVERFNSMLSFSLHFISFRVLFHRDNGFLTGNHLIELHQLFPFL